MRSATSAPNTWYYRPRARDASALRMRIRELAHARPRFGYLRIWVLLRREGWPDNKKRVHRLYCLEGLQVRLRTRQRKRVSVHRAVPPASGRNQARSMDFVHNQLTSGRTFRVLGTDGYGRSDFRSKLREHFEVNRHFVVLSALRALADEGSVPKSKVAEAIKKYGIDPNKANPHYA